MGLYEKFRNGLSRTRDATVGSITGLLRKNKIDEATLEDLVDALLVADIGVTVVEQLIEMLRQSKRNGTGEHVPVDIVKSELNRILLENGERTDSGANGKPKVILLVGVNGSGKTTTAGKLAYQYRQQGGKVVIAAADTFRAAAIEQLQTWAERSEARFIKSVPGADPASVTFDAYQSAIARGEDVVIVDTAGRLQAHRNLMEELGKIRRVVGKINPTAPHEVLLVIDSTTGQNGLSQARSFTNAAGVTGLVVTKLDGSARGGIVIPIKQELGLPIRYIGLGESIDDLQPFNSEMYVNALFDQ